MLSCLRSSRTLYGREKFEPPVVKKYPPRSLASEAIKNARSTSKLVGFMRLSKQGMPRWASEKGGKGAEKGPLRGSSNSFLRGRRINPHTPMTPAARLVRYYHSGSRHQLMTSQKRAMELPLSGHDHIVRAYTERRYRGFADVGVECALHVIPRPPCATARHARRGTRGVSKPAPQCVHHGSLRCAFAPPRDDKIYPSAAHSPRSSAGWPPRDDKMEMR